MGSQTTAKHTPLTTSLIKNPKPKTLKNLLFKTTRLPKSLQGLNTSLAQSAVELWLAKICSEIANNNFY